MMNPADKKNAHYNLIVKSLIIASVLFCLVFFDIQLQAVNVEPGKNPNGQIKFQGELSMNHKPDNEKFKVELIGNDKVIRQTKVSLFETFRFNLDEGSEYLVRISNKKEEVRLLRILTYQPAKAGINQIQAQVDLSREEDSRSSDLAPGMIAWDYIANDFRLIEDCTYKTQRSLYSEKSQH